MPLYEFECDECHTIQEILLDINENPVLQCEKCGSHDFHRVPSACSFKIANSAAARRARDRDKSNADMRKELLENYGVEKISPLRKTSLKSVYEDVKKQGSLIKEQMAISRENNQKKTKAKQKEWMQAAIKRTPGRRKEIQERKKAEDFKKRSIDLS